jgi:hypothetical protein
VDLPQHVLGLLEDPLIRERKDGEAQGAQVERALLVADGLPGLVVDGAVELDEEPPAGERRRKTVEEEGLEEMAEFAPAVSPATEALRLRVRSPR